ncbi:non-ribosomal peptide synthetase [Solwaraspora sp. WMMB335]|uniref:non-ribosomal peptide synthetase n=1 Tax=Solwaraspora sp. WMMB335 TaxID=3404118 RepID=UPI003B94CA8F
MTVPELILDRIHAESTHGEPSRLCLGGPDGELTYQQVGDVSAGLADRLLAHGVRPGEVVAIDAPRSTLAVCLALAVWRAGAAFLMFDPVQPKLRRQELLTDAGVRLLAGVTESEVTIDVVGDRPGHTSEDLAYVVYTSGSTGTPKGVLCRHRSLPPIVQMARDGFGITADDRVAMLAPLHVEGVVFEFMVPLALGASVHIPSVEQRGAPPELTKFLRERQVSVLVSTPTRLTDLDPVRFPALRLVISAGENLAPELARRWADGRRLINSYGVTEATIASTFAVIPPEVTRVPIGYPIAHNSVRVLDDHGRPVRPGGTGEMYLGGAGVAAGYLNRPQLTARRFVVVDGERTYRSGDFAEIDADGQLYFAGRRDGQVQLGGYRVEPGEVRGVLHGHPAVHDCAVIARDDRLVAYVVAHAPTTPAQLRDWLAQRLPGYLVPARYVLLAELPRTAWGKVDLPALPDPELVSGPADGSPSETTLAGLLGELLGTDTVRTDQFDDDLFLIGLTSILVARLIRRVEAELGVTLSPVDVFEHPTVRELAEVVDRARAAG